MNSNEFMKNNPELVQRAKKCRTREDFITLTEANDIKFDDITLDQAYDFLCGDGTLSEDALESVAGGKGGGKVEKLPPKLEYLDSNEKLSWALEDMATKKE